ncbi:MAG: DUF3631 domain-containing protein [Pseudomonadota bacterium]
MTKTIAKALTSSDATSSIINIAEILTNLAALSPLDYESIRIEQAKQLGWRTTVLDAEVKKIKTDDSEVSNLPFDTVEPFHEQVDPSNLLNEISRMIRNYIVLEPEQADAVALWIVLTWVIPHIDLAPLAIINAPEKACGKTQLLTVIGYMSYRPLPASNASSSAIFRAVEKWSPTILVDEADTFFKDNAELQGMVNAGYLRGGYVLRSEAAGDSFEPRMFSVFSAKAIAGIALEKHLPDATMSRGIIFNLRRKMATESVSRLRHADRLLFGDITSKLARFAEDYGQRVKYARPSLPETLSDRDQDNWQPMLAIAACAGEEWLIRATNAAQALSIAGEQSVSMGNQLLADIQYVFESKRIDKISTSDLIDALILDEEKPWATYNRGKQFSPRQLAKLLSAYGISSKTVRMGPYSTPKGFDTAQFNDVFARYLNSQPDVPQLGIESPDLNKDIASDVAAVSQPEFYVINDATPQRSYPVQNDSVAD